MPQKFHDNPGAAPRRALHPDEPLILQFATFLAEPSDFGVRFFELGIVIHGQDGRATVWLATF